MSELSPSEEVGYLVTVWSEVVATQRHFNDLEWRIRGLWVTALTFVLGGFYVATTHDKSVTMTLPLWMIPASGVALGLLFWFADAAWYHRFLLGAVVEGKRVEERLKELGIDVGLTGRITEWSRHPFLAPRENKKREGKQPRWQGITIRSSVRLRLFYALPCGLLALAAIVLAVFA